MGSSSGGTHTRLVSEKITWNLKRQLGPRRNYDDKKDTKIVGFLGFPCKCSPKSKTDGEEDFLLARRPVNPGESRSGLLDVGSWCLLKRPQIRMIVSILARSDGIGLTRW